MTNRNMSSPERQRLHVGYDGDQHADRPEVENSLLAIPTEQRPAKRKLVTTSAALGYFLHSMAASRTSDVSPGLGSTNGGDESRFCALDDPLQNISLEKVVESGRQTNSSQWKERALKPFENESRSTRYKSRLSNEALRPSVLFTELLHSKSTGAVDSPSVYSELWYSDVKATSCAAAEGESHRILSNYSVHPGIIVRVLPQTDDWQVDLFKVRSLERKIGVHWTVEVDYRSFLEYVSTVSSSTKLDKELCGVFRPLQSVRLPHLSWLGRHAALMYDRQRKAMDKYLRMLTYILYESFPMGTVRKRLAYDLLILLKVPRHLAQKGMEGPFRHPRETSSSKLEIAVRSIVRNPETDLGQTIEEFIRDYKVHLPKLMARNVQDRIRRLKGSKRYTANGISGLAIIQRHVSAVTDLLLETGIIDEFEVQEDKAKAIVYSVVEEAHCLPLELEMTELLRRVVPDEFEKFAVQRLKACRNMPPAFFGVPSHMQSKSDFETARRLYAAMDNYSLAADKVLCILAAAKSIFDEFEDSRNIAADDFLPMNIFAVVTSSVARPLSTVELLLSMCDDHTKSSEAGYFLTMFEAAVAYAQNLEVTEDGRPYHGRTI